MSGAAIKTFSILSFLLLVGGMVALAPGVDASVAYFVAWSDSGSGTEDDPFVGNVTVDGRTTNSAVLDWVYYFVEEGSTVTIDCSDFNKVKVKDSSENFVSPDIYSDDDAIFTFTVEDSVVYTADLHCYTTSWTGNDFTIYIVSVDSDTGTSAIDTTEIETIAEEGSSSGDGESGSGSDSGDSGGSFSDGDQSSAGDDNSDGSDEDFSDSSAVERQSSPVLAILILIAGAILIWWVVKKVRD